MSPLTGHKGGGRTSNVSERLVAASQDGSQPRMGSLLDEDWCCYLGHTNTDSDRRPTSDPHGDIDSQTVEERSNEDDGDTDGNASSSTVLGRDVITNEGCRNRGQKVCGGHETESVAFGVIEESIGSGYVSQAGFNATARAFRGLTFAKLAWLGIH